MQRQQAAAPLDKSWGCQPLLQQLQGCLGFLILQTPCYVLRWLCSLVQLPFYLQAGHIPTDADVVQLIEGSALCMMLTQQQHSSAESNSNDSAGSGQTYSFSFHHCQLVTAGRRLSSMSLVYQKQHQATASSGDTVQILSCTRNGKELNSREQMYATLVQYLVVAIHPKIHVAGVNLISRIGGIASGGTAGSSPTAHTAAGVSDTTILSACSYNTVPLHVFLMHTPWSPIANGWLSCSMGYGTATNKHSVADEATNMADMVQHKDKSQLALLLSLNNRYTHFLVHSRDVLLRAMVEHGVDARLFEQLWLHCIVHALDHVTLGDLVIQSKVLFSVADVWQDSSVLGRVRGFMFTRLFVQEVLSPLPWLSNRLRDLAEGRSWVVRLAPQAVAFWRDLYNGLSVIDPGLADHMTASIMY